MLKSLQEQGSLFLIKTDLAKDLEQILPLNSMDILQLLERPKNPEHGHLALPLFSLAKSQKKSPKELSSSLAELVKKTMPSCLEAVIPISGFLNFQFKSKFLQAHFVKLFSKKQLASFEHKKEHWLFDFASPNVAKHMNAGHLRASVLGQALVNLARCFDLKVTALNHLGDWGTQFGKLLWAYQHWSQEYDFKKQPLESLVSLYVRFHKEAEKDPDKNKQAASLFKKLEQGDKDLEKLWKFFVSISLQDYEKYWDILNVKHNLVLGESFYKDQVSALEDRLKKQNLLEESQGAKVVFLEQDKPPCLIVKSDGASTYAARDIASAIYRLDKLKVDKNIYVTGSDQKLHFEQVFACLDKMLPNKKASNKHISFGMYLFPGEGKMSSRGGQAVYLKDILSSAQDKVKHIMKSRKETYENLEEISKQIAVGAIVFNDLSTDYVKDLEFHWSRVLDFEGRTGPFVQYTNVRCLSLMKKYTKPLSKKYSGNFQTKEEQDLAWSLLCFEASVFLAFKLLKPHILTSYLLDICQQFNRFYASVRILESDRSEDLMELVQALSRVLRKGLEILNIPTPSQM